MKTIKSIIAFFVSIWVFLFGKKDTEPVKVEPKTIEKKIEEANTKIRHRIQRMIPQHNNRKNTRGRYVQHTPSGRAIYHDPTKKK
jgi:hypothetical protein